MIQNRIFTSSSCFALIFLSVTVFIPTASFSQTQYGDICQRQFDEAKPGSLEQLHAALKLTDALYHYDLEAALGQANVAFRLATELNDEQALAVCAMDKALITGWLKGQDEALEHFEMAVDLFDHTAAPDYRIHFYSAAILFEIFRNSGNSDLSEYFRLNEIASKECKDPHLVLHQNMLSAFNRVVLGRCSLEAPEIKFALAEIKKVNKQIGLHDADAILTFLEAWQARSVGDNENYVAKVYEGLELSRRSRNRLGQMFALGLLVAHGRQNGDFEDSLEFMNEFLELAQAHHSPPLIFHSLSNLAEIRKELGEFQEAKLLIDRAMKLEFLNSRSESDRHNLFKLAFELYCEEVDIENIKKYALLMSTPEHMRAVVETAQQNQLLVNEIAKLEQDKKVAEKKHIDSKSLLQERFDAAQEKAQQTILALSIMAAVMAIIGLITALYISRSRLYRVKKRLSEEQESGRHGKEIREGLESKLIRLQRTESLGLLAGGVAHDFNNLLVGVLGNAELLKMKADEHDEFVNGRITQIIRSAEKAAELSRQMLAYAGKQQIERKTVDLNQLVSRLVPVLKSDVNQDMDLQISYWSLPLVCEVDETQIEQVLMNLVSNAVAASGGFGQVLIRMGQEKLDWIDEKLYGNRTTGGQFNFIEVEDFGAGIAESEMERIFEPFYTDKENGRGLGLAVVYGMVNGHEGLIRAESKIEEGTKFRVLLPDALPEVPEDQYIARSSHKLVEDPIESIQPSILVVDDEIAVRDLAQQVLSDQGWHILLANNGIQALEQIAQHGDRLRCVILDVVMPEMGAIEFLREFNARNISLPVVLMSGFSNRQLREFRAEAQVVSIIEKPFRLDELIMAVDNAVGEFSRV